jgi:hypothetical protein
MAQLPVRAGGLALAISTAVTAARGQSPGCAPLDTTASWAQVLRQWHSEAGRSWTNDSLRQVLLGLRDADQAARAEFAQRVGDSSYARQLMATDSALSNELAGILDRFGLPTRSAVGAAGVDAAMLLAQHSATLQPRVLQLAQAAPPGEVSPEALAMLEDRVLVHEGRPQRLGTQFSMGADGVFRFAPIEDAHDLDARRAGAGLPPLLQYVCLLEEYGLRIDRGSLPPLDERERPR